MFGELRLAVAAVARFNEDRGHRPLWGSATITVLLWNKGGSGNQAKVFMIDRP